GKPRGVRHWIVVNSLPPTDYIAVCHHDCWNSALQHSVIKLVEVQNVRSAGGYDLLQILCGFRKGRFRILHPLERKRSGIVVQILVFHPGSLGRGGHSAEADESHFMSAIE